MSRLLPRPRALESREKTATVEELPHVWSVGGLRFGAKRGKADIMMMTDANDVFS